MCSIDSVGSVYIKLLDLLRRPFFSVNVLIASLCGASGVQSGEEKRIRLLKPCVGWRIKGDSLAAWLGEVSDTKALLHLRILSSGKRLWRSLEK